MTDAQFEKWVHTMNKANGAMPDAKKMITDLEKIQ
jgi:hypothetical protein